MIFFVIEAGKSVDEVFYAMRMMSSLEQLRD
jgi:hypothetical protein